MRAIRAVPFVPLLIISLVVALIAGGLGAKSIHWWYDRFDPMHLTFKVYGPALFWLFLVTLGFKVHGWKGCWLLPGAPFALAWPYEFTKLNLDCWRGLAISYMCD